MTWIPLLMPHSIATSLMCMMMLGKDCWLLGRVSLSIPELAQGTTCLGCAHTMPGLLGLLLHTARLSSGWLYPTSVCGVYSDLGWAVTTCLKMWVAGLQFPGHKGFAMSAILISQVMSTTLSLSVEVCSTFVIDTLDYLEYMLGQCFRSCGRQTYMG